MEKNGLKRQEAMAKKLEVLRNIKERYCNADLLQYIPNEQVEFNFIKHLYLMVGAENADILKVTQNAVGVLNVPESDAERNISRLLQMVGFTTMELSRLETFALLQDRGTLLKELHRMMRVCMAAQAVKPGEVVV
ncbi:hypothetical protein [Paenibacillus sp. Y412MC10]|uniref:hypothetical protein n=1 Tax=Geobacillus sp. (strain Y412MC10) TaxID=481743 RepID=UPI0011AB707A|nr:hypothetical protein [Paenibacillus sp. Y412MC10]